jgi:hypothetical protein
MISPEDKERIFEEIRFVSKFTSDCDDWVTIKKEVMKGLPPSLRKTFSTRDSRTKEQTLNDFEKIIINYYYDLTGVRLILRTLAERRGVFYG